MSVALDKLHRFGIKIFLQPGASLDPPTCIPIFHRWIRDRVLGDLLIDVADYTHLVDGPSVLLVGHEGNLAIDFSNQRAGLFYTRKRPDEHPLEERLAGAARTLFSACRLLEEDPALTRGGGVTFAGDELHVVSNDRLVAPSNGDTADALRTRLEPLVDALYGEESYDVTSLPVGKDRLTLSVKSNTSVPVETLLSRLRA